MVQKARGKYRVQKPIQDGAAWGMSRMASGGSRKRARFWGTINVARHSGGWFKAWRKAWDSDLSQNLHLWGIWQAFLHMATWKETRIIWKGQQRVLPPGSVVFGYRELSERLQCGHTTIAKWSKYLHDTGRIVLESSTRGSLATICNWESYQATDDDACTEHVRDADVRGTRRVHGADLNEESKNIRNKELTREQVEACVEQWGKSLRHWNNPKNPKLDDHEIYRLIAQFGFETVHMALAGFRGEAKTGDYDPARHLTFERIRDRGKRERLVNLGARVLAEDEKRAAPAAQSGYVENSWEDLMAGRVS